MARGARTPARGPADEGSPGSRRRKARLSTPALAGLAVGVSALVMVGLTFQTVQAHASCVNGPVLNVAVSQDIAPAVGTVAQYFNQQGHIADGRCVQVQVTDTQSAAVTAELDGQASSAGQAAVQAWIPDSTLWVDVARSYPRGAQAVQPTGMEVAVSPLMTAMPMAVAKETGEFDSPAGWNVLLPAGYGGPPASVGMKVLIPDPADSAAGLAALVQLSRLLGAGAPARAAFTQFTLASEASSEFDNPTSLASFVATAGAPFDSRSVTVTSEQAVIAYDRANPAAPLAAQYPTGLSSRLGTESLDYPFVLTTTDPVAQAAAREFEQVLRQSYAQAVIRYAGFRSPDGAADATPPSYGLDTQLLQTAAAASASEAQTNLEAWGRLALGTRVLVLIDVSKNMAARDGNGTQTLAQETATNSELGLALFPDTTQIGLWEMADNLTGSLPYRQLVPIGLLSQQVGLISRRQQLQQIDETLQPGGQPLKLNDSILAAYKTMTADYNSHYQNAVIVLTSGVDAPGDLPTAALVAQLRRLFNPNRGIQIVIDQIGTAGDLAAEQQIASVTGGAAYEVSNPATIGTIFIEAFSHRLCDPRCSPTP
jgi:Ca-activated chloride channel family protein